MRFDAYRSREGPVLPELDESAIGGEDDIDDCDSIVGEAVSQELISVLTKEVPVVVQPSTKKKGNPICVPRNVNFDVSKWSDSRVLTESRCNQPSPPRSGGSRGPHVPWDVEGASLLIKSPERKSYRRTTENNRRRKTITGYAPSIHNGFSDRGSKSAQKPAPGSQIRRLTATPGMKNAASEISSSTFYPAASSSKSGPSKFAATDQWLDKFKAKTTEPPRVEPRPLRSSEKTRSDYFAEKKVKMKKPSDEIHEISDSDNERDQPSRNRSPPLSSNSSTLDAAIQYSKSAPPSTRRVDMMKTRSGSTAATVVFGQFPSVKIVKLFKNGQMVHGLSLNLKVHDNVKFASASSVLEEFHNSEVLEAEYFDHYEEIIFVFLRKDDQGIISRFMCYTESRKEFEAFKAQVKPYLPNFRLMKESDYSTNLLLVRESHTISRTRSATRQSQPSSAINDFFQTLGPSSARHLRPKAAPAVKTYELFSFSNEKGRKPGDEMFVYPFTGRNRVTVHVEDARRMSPGEFLNDTMIEFYIKYLCNTKLAFEMVNQTHIFNSFFYETLTRKDDGDKKSTDPQVGYDRVKSWTSKVDIFSKKFIVVPINEYLHWYLAIIYNPAALLEDAGSVELSSATAQTFEDAFEDFRNLPQSCSADNMVAFEDANMTTPAYPELETAETNIEGLPDHFDSADVVMEEVLEEGSSSKPVECSPTQASNSDSVGHSQSSQESVVVSRKRSPQPIELGSSPTRTPGKRGLKKKSAIERDKEREKEAKVCQALQKCHVIILDSLGNSHSVALKNLKTYLMLEAQEKKKLHIVQKTFGIHAKAPVQPNHCDCGVFLLHYFELFMSDPDTCLYKILLKENNKDWFPYSVIADKRREIFNLTEKMEQEYLQFKTQEQPS